MLISRCPRWRRAALTVSGNVIRPAVAIKVRREDPADVIIRDGIDPKRVNAAEVGLDCTIIQRRKFLMRTFRALDLRFAACTRPPFVVAGRCVSALPRFGIFPSLRKNGAACPEQIEKQGHSLSGRLRCLLNRWGRG